MNDRTDLLPSSWWQRLTSLLRTLATHDFFPEISVQVRRVVYHPLGVLLAAASVSLLCGLFLHAQGFVLFGGVLAVVVLGILWPRISLWGTSGSLAFTPSRTTEGEPVDVLLTLRNRLPWSVWGLTVRDGFGGEGAKPIAGIASVRGRRTCLGRWTFQPRCRGVYPLRTPRLTTGFPFGLWENGRPLNVDRSLIVWPRTYPVGPTPSVSGERLVEGVVSRSKVGTNGDVLGVRPYRRGDSPRRIHWAQSARHDRLIVCELQSNSRPVIQFLLDADPRVHVGVGSDSSREWAIRIVASLAVGWLDDGAQIGLAWNECDLPPASGAAQKCRILDALATLPDGPSRPIADVLACPRCRGFREGLQVIVTTDRAELRTIHRSGRLAGDSSWTSPERWVLLRTAAFCGETPSTGEPSLPVQPWLWIDDVDHIPALLRGGWREARHGS